MFANRRSGMVGLTGVVGFLILQGSSADAGLWEDVKKQFRCGHPYTMERDTVSCLRRAFRARCDFLRRPSYLCPHGKLRRDIQAAARTCIESKDLFEAYKALQRAERLYPDVKKRCRAQVGEGGPVRVNERLLANPKTKKRTTVKRTPKSKRVRSAAD